MKKTIGIVVVVAVVAGMSGFFLGKNFSAPRSFEMNGQPGGRMALNGEMGKRRQTLPDTGGVIGTILSQEGEHMTLSVPNGGSRIILVPSSAQVQKLASGSANDLIVGTSLFVSGDTNVDGSITARTIQIRN